ncbi:MAG TPA: hypothetical protein VND91_05855 [Candidatus Saccharimonadia bacterium]|nr:hypothetical protein [Candidatus Saccharimonadia bacterium]
MRWIVGLAFAVGATFALDAHAVPQHPHASPTTRIESPTAHAFAIIDALRANDAEAFAEAVSRKSSDELAREWETERAKAAEKSKDHEHGEDAERVWSMLMTDEGTAALVAELQPKISEKASTAVLQFNLGLAAMLTAVATEAGLSPTESQQFTQVVLAVQRWATGIDWSDPARLDRALAEASGLVRRSGLKSPRELVTLPYERALALGDDAIATFKGVLRAYDIDVDATLASISLEELERDGDRATVRTRVTVLGVPLDVTRELRHRHGRWNDARHSRDDDIDVARARPAVVID